MGFSCCVEVSCSCASFRKHLPDEDNFDYFPLLSAYLQYLYFEASLPNSHGESGRTRTRLLLFKPLSIFIPILLCCFPSAISTYQTAWIKKTQKRLKWSWQFRMECLQPLSHFVASLTRWSIVAGQFHATKLALPIWSWRHNKLLIISVEGD